MARILPRSTWTSTAKGFTRISNRRLTPSRIQWLIGHYPAMGNITIGNNPSLASSCQRLRGWRNLHVGTNGWADLGYPYAIDQAGRIFEGAGDTHAAAHTIGQNFTGLAVLFIVGNNERPSAKARAAFRALGRHLRATKFSNMRTRARGHQQFPGNATACPGQPIMRDLSNGVLNFGGNSSTSTPAASGGTYTVRAGDTLGAIAKANGTTVSALQSANNIRNANLIRVGQRLTIPSSSSSSSSSSSGSGASANLARSKRMTRWPARPLPVRDFPRGTYWLQPPRSNAPVVPDEYRHALVVALGEAGFPYRERTMDGAYRQLRQWLRERHGYNTGTARLSIIADFQRYLTAQGLYRGKIDGLAGPQTIWAITTWLNRIRGAYNN